LPLAGELLFAFKLAGLFAIGLCLMLSAREAQLRAIMEDVRLALPDSGVLLNSGTPNRHPLGPVRGCA
jgi:hypothetical protein